MPKNFRVLIAGGGIAGLTLANMFERLGIDYLLLEANSDIAPVVGASIGLLANGLRILDQIDLYEDVRKLIDQPNHYAQLRGPDAKMLSFMSGLGQQFSKRHGYDIVFVDRQQITEVIARKLKHRDRILLNKKVQQVFLEESGVKVMTCDGSTYTGDILIGADGIHSKVRNEMWRLADLLQPGYIPQSEHTASLPTSYKCIYGISVMPEWVKDTNMTNVNKSHSYLIVSGPDDRVYWFLFVDMGKMYHAEELPRFTKADEDLVVAQHKNDKLTEKFTFRDLYSKKVSSILTPLPEYVFKKWHFSRIMTVGDACHKFNPISGQGGNSAIETTAVLTNNLVHMLKATPDGAVPTVEQIHACFAATQAKREPRAWKLVHASHAEQSTAALEGAITEAFLNLLGPHMSVDQKVNPWTTNIEAGHRLEMLPVPKRARFVPFQDELPATPLASSGKDIKILTAAALLMLFGVAQVSLVLHPDIFLPSNTFQGSPLKESFTGIPAIDVFLHALVYCFSEPVAGASPHQHLQCVYFLINLLPVVFIMTVESYRNGSWLSPVSLPVLYGIAYQTMGIGKILPLYFLISLYPTSNKIYTRTTGRPIPAAVAKALVPALCLGAVLPTVAMFMPHADPVAHQNAIAFWQPLPVYVALLTWGFSRLIGMAEGSNKTATALLEQELFEQKDLVPLYAGYTSVFAVSAVSHGYALLYSSRNSVSLWETFLNLPAVRDVGLTGDIAAFFKYDMVLAVAAMLVWGLYSVFELRRLGYVTTAQAVRAGLAVVAGQAVVGPGATYAGLWAWRENAIASSVIDGK